ncbi:MAG: hypothetical protein GXN96_00470 [Aquificae bacterium]|nr:hypothetical protein [Aquificota bacterium]
MLQKITRDVLFVSRLFTVFYLSLFLLIDYKIIDFSPVLILSVYFLVNVYIYFFSKPSWLKVVATLLDLTLIPAYILLSGNFLNTYAMALLITAYSPRKTLLAVLLTLEASLVALYYLYTSPLLLSATLLLFIGLLFSSYSFEYSLVMGKERKRIAKLRKNYSTLLKDLSLYERERRLLRNLRRVFEILRESREPKEYLSLLRKEFGLKKIRVVPSDELPGEVVRDYDRGVLVVPVRFEKGQGSVIFEFDSPFRLRDEILVESLTEAAKLLRVMVEGFEENQNSVKALVVG